MDASVEIPAPPLRLITGVPVALVIRVKLAASEWESAASFQLRRDVFCIEQGLFEGDDRDAIDAHALPIVALCETETGMEVIGTVRIHMSEPGVWHGSRLAVARHARRIGNIGSCLIKLAVSTANARNCHAFLAEVQRQNVPLFRRLHWQALSEIEAYGLMHQVMQADLSYFPPNAVGELDLTSKDFGVVKFKDFDPSKLPEVELP